MWCATGELIRTHVLAKAGDDAMTRLSIGSDGKASLHLHCGSQTFTARSHLRTGCGCASGQHRWMGRRRGDDDFPAELGLVSDDGRSSWAALTTRDHELHARPGSTLRLFRPILPALSCAPSRLLKILGLQDSSSGQRPRNRRPAIQARRLARRCRARIGNRRTRSTPVRGPRDPNTSLQEGSDALNLDSSTTTRRDGSKPSWQTVFVYEAWGDTRSDERDE